MIVYTQEKIRKDEISLQLGYLYKLIDNLGNDALHHTSEDSKRWPSYYTSNFSSDTKPFDYVFLSSNHHFPSQ